MFTHGLKSLESIPPTKHALFQHAKRSLLIASFIWSNALIKSPEVPDPAQWGWEYNDRTKVWFPHWTDLPDVSQGCTLLVRCGCVVPCSGHCKCAKSGLRFYSLLICQNRVVCQIVCKWNKNVMIAADLIDSWWLCFIVVLFILICYIDIVWTWCDIAYDVYVCTRCADFWIKDDYYFALELVIGHPIYLPYPKTSILHVLDIPV